MSIEDSLQLTSKENPNDIYQGLDKDTANRMAREAFDLYMYKKAKNYEDAIKKVLKPYGNYFAKGMESREKYFNVIMNLIKKEHNQEDRSSN